jgi:ribosomal protein S18 acetylase RimI-like enzyme
MVAVRERSLAHDQLDPFSPRDPLPTVDELLRRFADAPPGDPRVLIVEHNGGMIGWARIIWWTEEDGTRVYLHLEYLLPEWRGKGIGAAMIDWAETTLRARAIDDASDRGSAVLATNAAVNEREKTATLEHLGYEVVRWLCEMRADDLAHIPPTSLPEGVEILPVTPDQYHAIYLMTRAAWTGLWGTLAEGDEAYEDFLDEMVRVPNADPALWMVAWHGEEAVAKVIARVTSGHGYVDSVATHPAWRRQGIAGTLLLEVLRAFAARGLTQARLYTDAANGQGARSLYESAGFGATAEHRLYRKPLTARPGAHARALPF